MILKNKKLLILSSLLILLPIPVGFVLRSFYPDRMIGSEQTLWPVLGLLVGQWVCVLITARDPSNKNRNRKPLSMVLWIMPLMSNLLCGILYALMLGVEFSPTNWMAAGMGLMFAIIGNYLPKTKMNATVGIKIATAYSSEENWNATHRFAGKVWVIGGIAIIFSALLPEGWAVPVMTISLIVLCVLPIWYSHRYYRMEKAEGKDVTAGYSKLDKKLLKGSAVFLTLILIFCAVVLFAGDIDYQFREDSLLIDSSIYTDHVLTYDSIEALEYREGNVPGSRVGGFGSARLLMGFFKNEEFGTYIRYTYTKPEACVVVTTQGRPLVLSGRTPEETQGIYQTLLEKTGK